MSPEQMVSRLERLKILHDNAEQQKHEVYNFLCKGGVTSSQLQVFTNTFADLDKKQSVFQNEIKKLTKELAV